jgi:hypothetical protein
MLDPPLKEVFLVAGPESGPTRTTHCAISGRDRFITMDMILGKKDSNAFEASVRLAEYLCDPQLVCAEDRIPQATSAEG